MRLFGLLVLAIWPGALWAQDWATTKVCTVQDAAIDESVFPGGRAALEAKAAGIKNRRGRFWQITAPDGAVSHLWGTFHSSDPLILDLPEQVKSTIADARVVAIEVDYVLRSREAVREAQYYEGRFRPPSDPFAFLPHDGSIADLPPEISGWIIDRAIELGWTEDANLILSSAGMAEMLLGDPCEDFSNYVLPMQDDYVQLLGRLAGAEILSLEAPHQFLDDLNASEETAKAIIAVYGAYLKPMTSNTDRATAFALYREGRLGLMAMLDAAFLESVLGDRAGDALRLTDGYLIAERNERFMARLAGPLAGGGVFVAVGAGHLAGETGLVKMLRNAGHDVERIAVPGEAE